MKAHKLRTAAVAGKFYPSSAHLLKNQLKSLLGEKVPKKDVIACILPHAGYMYSGRVAVETVSQVNIKERIILLGPNHTGYGVAFSIMSQGIWQTPLGKVSIDSELAGRILKNSKYLQDDELAHEHEHSLEVELPVLQYFKPNFKIVPIVLSADHKDVLKRIGEEIAGVIKEDPHKDTIMIVASTDMTHFESEQSAKVKDREAINAILELDEDKLMDKITSLDISMCGYAPVITTIKLAKLLGAKSAKLVKYQTSADAIGQKDSVVGYAGITIY